MKEVGVYNGTSWVYSGAGVRTITAGNSTITVDNTDPENPTISITPLTANRVIVSDGSGNPSASAITTSTLAYIGNLTSDAQSQIDTKITKVAGATSGNLPVLTAGGELQDSLVIISTDGTMVANSDQKVPTEKAVISFIDNKILSLGVGQGNYDASSGLFPATRSDLVSQVRKDDIFFISVAGTLGGKLMTPGDTLRALVDNPGQTASNWNQGELNFGYVAENEANKSTDNTLGGVSASDISYPSQKAVKDYVDNATKSYQASFVAGDFVSNELVISAATHGLGTGVLFDVKIQDALGNTYEGSEVNIATGAVKIYGGVSGPYDATVRISR